jgi:hypothetical protein
MDIAAAQRDMAIAYVGGAPGVFVSGAAWLIAAIVEQSHGIHAAFAVLFVGGMLIVPVSLLIARILFGTSKVSAGNPFERLGLESTMVLFAGILIGYAMLRIAPELAFPALAVTSGARYFAFRAIYGEPAYWVLGGVLAMIGALAILRQASLPSGSALMVGLAECTFAVLLLMRWNRRKRQLTPGPLTR